MSLFENDYELFGNDEVTGFVLLDEGTVSKPTDNHLNALIEIRGGDARFPNEPYMKISKSKKGWNGADKKERTRISLKYLAYIDHPSDPGEWRLTRTEREILVKDLNSPYKNTGYTLWEAILKEAYKSSHQRLPEDFVDLPLLDYNDLNDTDKPSDRKVKYYGV